MLVLIINLWNFMPRENKSEKLGKFDDLKASSSVNIDQRKPIIAVTMATGLQGRGVVRELSKTNKFKIRAMTRNPGSEAATVLSKLPNVEIFKGDLLDKKSLEACFEKAYGIFGNTTPTQGFRPLVRKYELSQGYVLFDVIENIKAQGFLKHLIFSSICKAKDPLKNTPAPSHFLSKWEMEEYLIMKNLGDITTILRPASYFENFNGDLPGLKITNTSFPGVVKPNYKWQTIAAGDVGKWATAAFNNPKRFIQQSINLAAEEMTGSQMADLLKEVNGNKSKTVSYKMAPRIFMKLFVHDIGVMADWIERTGYGADINDLKQIADEEGISITSLSSWLKKITSEGTTIQS